MAGVGLRIDVAGLERWKAFWRRRRLLNGPDAFGKTNRTPVEADGDYLPFLREEKICEIEVHTVIHIVYRVRVTGGRLIVLEVGQILRDNKF